MLTIDMGRVGELVLKIGTQNFGNSFYAVFRDLLNIDECTVFSFPNGNQPLPLVVESDTEENRAVARRLADDYVSGGYREDPNVRTRKKTLDVHVMAAKDIRNRDYRKHYYDLPSVSHELVLFGEYENTLFYASFYRKQWQDLFRLGEIETMRALADFIIKTLHRHSELVATSDCAYFEFLKPRSDSPHHQRRQMLEHLRNVLLAGPYRLSQREAEVCAGIVMGYSTLAISLNCSISVNTVATHRKRAYAKLGISSQNELFTRYFTIVTEFQAAQANELDRSRLVGNRLPV